MDIVRDGAVVNPYVIVDTIPALKFKKHPITVNDNWWHRLIKVVLWRLLAARTGLPTTADGRSSIKWSRESFELALEHCRLIWLGVTRQACKVWTVGLSTLYQHMPNTIKYREICLRRDDSRSWNLWISRTRTRWQSFLFAWVSVRNGIWAFCGSGYWWTIGITVSLEKLDTH